MTIGRELTSFPGYLHLKDRKSFVHYQTILEYFGGTSRRLSNEYKKFIAEGVDRDISNPLKKEKGTLIIGNDDFIEVVRERCGKDQGSMRSRREQPALRKLGGRNPDDLIDQYARLVKIGMEELTRKGKQSEQRAMRMELPYRICSITQAEIGKLSGGIDYKAVSQARRRLQIKIDNNPDLAQKLIQVQNAMVKCQ